MAVETVYAFQDQEALHLVGGVVHLEDSKVILVESTERGMTLWYISGQLLVLGQWTLTREQAKDVVTELQRQLKEWKV